MCGTKPAVGDIGPPHVFLTESLPTAYPRLTLRLVESTASTMNALPSPGRGPDNKADAQTGDSQGEPVSKAPLRQIPHLSHTPAKYSLRVCNPSIDNETRNPQTGSAQGKSVSQEFLIIANIQTRAQANNTRQWSP